MIAAEWKPTGAPCDSCGQHERNAQLVVSLTNAKAIDYRLPGLALCVGCRIILALGVSAGSLLGDAVLTVTISQPPPTEPAG